MSIQYDESNVPCPRIQFTVDNGGENNTWKTTYELVVPSSLSKKERNPKHHDKERDEWRYELDYRYSVNATEPCTAPFSLEIQAIEDNEHYRMPVVLKNSSGYLRTGAKFMQYISAPYGFVPYKAIHECMVELVEEREMPLLVAMRQAVSEQATKMNLTTPVKVFFKLSDYVLVNERWTIPYMHNLVGEPHFVRDSIIMFDDGSTLGVGLGNYQTIDGISNLKLDLEEYVS